MSNFNKERANKAFESLIGKTEAVAPIEEKKAAETKSEPRKTKEKVTAGAKEKVNHVNVTFYITPEQNKALRYRCIEEDCDMSSIVRKALDKYLKL
jgi:hypothetical protein